MYKQNQSRYTLGLLIVFFFSINTSSLFAANDIFRNLDSGFLQVGQRMQMYAGDDSRILFGPNSTWGASLNVGAGVSTLSAGTAQVISTNGNLHLDSGPANNTFINWYSQTNTFLNGQGGNVGIGTTSPSYKLQVQKTSAAPAMMIGGGFAGSPRFQIYGLDADANGWMGLGTDMGGGPYEHSLYFPTGPSSNGRFTIGDYNGTTYNTRMTVLQNGNIGIGTPTPGSKLDVNGQVKITGGSPGAGKVLSSDTAGLASWTNSLPVQSARDFPNGTLIQTDIDYSVTAGDPWLLEISGNSYGAAIPFDLKYQGYIYSNTIINHGGISNGTNVTGMSVFNYGGNLCFWFPNQSYWQGFTVEVNDSGAGVKKNRVTSITNAAKPGGITKEVAMTFTQSLHSGNYTSYTPSLTGGGASGTWGINITGNAATATNATNAQLAARVDSPDGDRNAATKLPTTNGHAVRFDFVSAATANGGGNYAGLMTYAPWDGTTASTGDASYQLAFNSTATNGGGIPYLSLRKGIDSTWNSWYTLLHSGNFNSYAPTLTGGGASGTWGINITGSAPWASITGKPTTLGGYGITDAVTTGGSEVITGVKYFQSNKGATSTVGANSSYQLEAYSNDAGAAGMSFHRAGQYAVNMGLDPDNVLRIGGWSAPANRWQLDMSGNMTAAGNITAVGGSYAPAFYDSNNTGYYVDPNGTSNMANINFGGTLCINGICPTNGAIRLTPNLHLNAGAGSAVILNWDNGTTGASDTLRIGNGAGVDSFRVAANGNVVANGTVTAATPTASSHLATKGYVDAAVSAGGVQYLGVTSATYDGNLGGALGANAKCQVNYAGSHMCSWEEIKKAGVTMVMTGGWVQPDIVGYDAVNGYWTIDDGTVFGGAPSAAGPTCDRWLSNSSGWIGTFAPSVGTYILTTTCNQIMRIQCCK